MTTDTDADIIAAALKAFSRDPRRNMQARERAAALPEEIARLQARVTAWVAAASQTGLLLPDAAGMPRQTASAVSVQAQVDRLRHERDHARASMDNAVKLLVRIHSLLYPAPITMADGRTMVFRPTSPDPHEVLQELSDRIRALPDEIAAIQAGE